MVPQQAGDLILYNSEETNDHGGIYVGGGKVVHAHIQVNMFFIWINMLLLKIQSVDIGIIV